jgi:hypothetical protein
MELDSLEGFIIEHILKRFGVIYEGRHIMTGTYRFRPKNEEYEHRYSSDDIKFFVRQYFGEDWHVSIYIYARRQ